MITNNSDNDTSILDILTSTKIHAIGPRKQRLFAVACCRAAWDHFVDSHACHTCAGTGDLDSMAQALGDRVGYGPCHTCAGTGRINRCHHAILIAESYADGNTTDAERQYACDQAVLVGLEQGPSFAAARCAENMEYIAITPPIVSRALMKIVPRQAQAAILRDIIGDQTHRIHSERDIDYAWLTWNDGTVAKLAKEIYTQRTYHTCPILADALEDAGCHDTDILTHLRDTTNHHVRGCWVLDLLLGQE